MCYQPKRNLKLDDVIKIAMKFYDPREKTVIDMMKITYAITHGNLIVSTYGCEIIFNIFF